MISTHSSPKKHLSNYRLRKIFGQKSDDLKKPFLNLSNFIDVHLSLESLVTPITRIFALKAALLDASGSLHETTASCRCESNGEYIQTL